MEIVISGYGKMGHMIEELLLERGIVPVTTENVCALDSSITRKSVCIDFTTPDAFRANYRFLADNFKAVVVGTTGWNDIEDEVREYFLGKGTPMIWSSNFSLGVNAVFAAARTLGNILKNHGYTPHIDETHHIHKLDAPSGTARTLEGIVRESLGEECDISSYRIGEVNGTHVLKLESGVDSITLSHEAFSRKGFAEGAVAAAMMTEGLTGVHSFSDLLVK